MEDELYYTDPINQKIANRIKVVNKKMNPPAWKNHMWLLNQPLPTIEETVDRITSMRNKEYKALFTMIYLTGSRVSEITSYRDLKTKEIKENTIPLKFVWLEDENNHVIQLSERLEPKWLVIQTRVLKLRKSYKKKYPQKKWKKAYINVNDTRIHPLLIVINEHINRLYNQDLDAPMFRTNLKPQLAHRMAYKYLRWNPHYLRHLRASHLVKYYGYNDTDLRAALGWASTSMSARYTHSDEESLKRKMEVY